MFVPEVRKEPFGPAFQKPEGYPTALAIRNKPPFATLPAAPAPAETVPDTPHRYDLKIALAGLRGFTIGLRLDPVRISLLGR